MAQSYFCHQQTHFLRADMTVGVTIEQLQTKFQYVKLINSPGFGEQAFSLHNQMDEH